MSATEAVTIGVPVYQGELFIEETLRSIQSQTYREIEIIISLDGPQPGAEELCRPFLKDSRFHLITQPERLGWVGNINWLMTQVATPYWCNQPQDDLMDSGYIEVLVDYARRMPEGAVFYCDIEAFGTLHERLIQPSVTGSASTRQLALLNEHFDAVAFRGLTRFEALHLAGGIPSNEVDSFGCDTVWMAAMARWGELWRVPGEMYRKRFHPANEHRKWFGWSVEKFNKAWIVHCAAMLEQAMLVEATAQERRLLWLAAAGRLTSLRTAINHLPIASRTGPERESLLNAFFEYVRTTMRMNIPALLEDRWEEIQQWTRGFLVMPPQGRGSDLLV
jgi:hypothetical protein